MSRLDQAVTIFAPDGRLLQVEYAQQCVRMGSIVVGVRGLDTIVIATKKPPLRVLQSERSIQKIYLLDSHVFMSFAGLTADARVIISAARLECQQCKLTTSEPVTVQYLSKHIAELNEKYTISNGCRPFGVSCLIGGVNDDGSVHLFQTEPSGIYYEWKAAAIGHSSETVRTYLEQNYNTAQVATQEGAIQLAIKGILEVMQADETDLILAVKYKHLELKLLDEKTIKEYICTIQNEKNN